MNTQRMQRMSRAPRTFQDGVILLEALIGILIFSLGIMALVAMQSVSVSNVSNARYRVEAAFLANEMLSMLWTDRTNIDNYVFPGGTSTQLAAWRGRVTALMPSSAAYPPTVAIAPLAGAPNGRQVTVTVRWKAPDALAPSNHIAIGYISDP